MDETDMDASDAERSSCLLESSPAAPASARDFVAKTLQRWGVRDRFPDVDLLTSELVTNAVRHARGDVHVAMDLLPSESIRIEVRDLSERLPVLRPIESARDGGWGLHIVGRIATRWGLEQRTGEKTIWCEIAPTG